MKAIEATEAQRNGGDAPAPPEAAAHFAEILAHERATAARIERFMRQGLIRAEALARLEALRAQPTPPQGVRGAQPPVRSALRFDRRAYIELSFDARQLKAIRRYIQLNPARALWKHHHPDRFLRITNIRHAILDPAHVWSAMGNLTLLGSPFLVHARLTLKKSLAEHEPMIAELVEKARRGAVIVSGFISPGEVELLKRLKATPNARFVKMLPCALPPRYDPLGRRLARTRRRPHAHPLGLHQHDAPYPGPRDAPRPRRRPPLPCQLPRPERPRRSPLRKGCRPPAVHNPSSGKDSATLRDG